MATVLGASTPVVWSLSGPGRLSTEDGAATRYTPPPAGDVQASVPATIVASARELERSLALTVNPAPGAPGPVPGTRWEIVRYPKAGFADLRELNGRLYLVGNGGILHSRDGIQWTACPTPPGTYYAIGSDGSRYIAVGRRVCASSTDGSNWTTWTPPPGEEHLAATGGQGVFIAAGSGGLYRTVDGTAWEAVGPPGLGRALAVTFGAGRFVAVGNT
ncbi:MAG: WD40/YVTN/BNR-like repeat-containing protein, partial [Aquabacterium sp.]